MKVVTFGEIMMRLNPEGYYRLCQADRLEVSYAGGEANVAAELSCLGIDASFVTKLPKTIWVHAHVMSCASMAFLQIRLFMGANVWACIL